MCVCPHVGVVILTDWHHVALMWFALPTGSPTKHQLPILRQDMYETDVVGVELSGTGRDKSPNGNPYTIYRERQP